MISRSFTIRNKLGLHARPSAQITQTASRFQSEVFIAKDDAVPGVARLNSRGTAAVRAIVPNYRAIIQHCLIRPASILSHILRQKAIVHRAERRPPAAVIGIVIGETAIAYDGVCRQQRTPTAL